MGCNGARRLGDGEDGAQLLLGYALPPELGDGGRASGVTCKEL